MEVPLIDSSNSSKPLSQYPAHLIESIFSNVAEGIMITDADKNIIGVNAAFEFVTGYKMREVIGCRPSIIQSGLHETDFYLNMWSSIREQGYWQGEIWNRRKTGDAYPEILKIMEIKNSDGEVTNYCGIFTDITDKKHAEFELQQMLIRDSLTDIANRASYIDRMEVLLESTAHKKVQPKHAVYYLNLKRFKQLNDSFGHAVADSVLVEVACRIRDIIKNKDIFARFGSDEFVVTIANIANEREAIKYAERILDEIEQPLCINNQDVFLSATMGISIYPTDGETTEVLINNADRAMTYSKEEGLGRFTLYFDGLNRDTKRVMLLDTELRNAIKKREFTIHLQPKIDTITRDISGFEALVRWNNMRLGQVSPAEFIPYAEETGLIIPLSEIIFEKACEAAIHLRDTGYSQYPIAVNVSSIHFQEKNFIQSLQDTLARYNISANHFEIELTERTMMNKDIETIQKLNRLKEAGFKLSIDDFGTGYSSLSYLIRFPLDVLKIDRSFIQQICDSEDKQAVVDAIIQMSHKLQMQVVAEGVETEQQAALLREMNCDYIQGFYYSKPLPMNELLTFIQIWEIEQQGR